ncbi:hypothetical protein DXV76_05070 [Rhodobacteraceae bacterium CCMM004]|nr:hypothetical protein DXV76_05070 [Rhodobacteraceae bacterium CCMM004]
MNVNRIVTMVTRMIMRRLISKGVNAGLDRAFGAKKPNAQMTPEERRQAAAAGQNARRARQAAKMARRAGRF